MSAPPAEANDILSIPASADGLARVEITWSSWLKSRSKQFLVVPATNITRGRAAVVVFIQEEYLREGNHPEHVSKFPGARREGDQYMIPISHKMRYGQKNKAGENRFIVIHDTSDTIYQHRFVTTTVQGIVANACKQQMQSGGDDSKLISFVGQIQQFGSNFMGDPLRKFIGV